ncbi:hypothetical protein EKO04_007946 [Ascochyta lentis]|uniref:Uncharacterized protein n=1 Tax=Ascochyta lentis TaxID=205686 RepID=A0A8H7J308_9PLEO|nr:hypothetical protein EKO04_007946 [Ascochyta lentis]
MFLNEEQTRVLQATPPGYFISLMDGAPLGPAPHTVGDLQPAVTTCTVKRDFQRFDYEYKKGVQGQYVAEHTDKEGKVWARIVVDGLTDAQRQHRYEWVERADVDINGVSP